MPNIRDYTNSDKENKELETFSEYGCRPVEPNIKSLMTDSLSVSPVWCFLIHFSLF